MYQINIYNTKTLRVTNFPMSFSCSAHANQLRSAYFTHVMKKKFKFVEQCNQSINHSVLPKGRYFTHTQHSPLYPLPSLPFCIFIQSIYHNVVYHLISSSASNFFPIYHTFRASLSRQFLLSQWPSQFLFLFLTSPSIILPSPTLSSTTAFFIQYILLHIHISNASSCFCSFRRSVHVSAPHNTTFHTKHFTSLFLCSFFQGTAQNASFSVKGFFAIAILCFTS